MAFKSYVVCVFNKCMLFMLCLSMENKVEYSEMALSFFPDANSCQECSTDNCIKYFVEILLDLLY